MSPFQSRPKQYLPEAHRVTASHGGRVGRLQFAENVGSGQVKALFMGKRGAEPGSEHLFDKAGAVELFVMSLQFSLFFLGEPVTSSGRQFSFQLGKNLVMFYVGTVNIMLHFHA